LKHPITAKDTVDTTIAATGFMGAMTAAGLLTLTGIGPGASGLFSGVKSSLGGIRGGIAGLAAIPALDYTDDQRRQDERIMKAVGGWFGALTPPLSQSPMQMQNQAQSSLWRAGYKNSDVSPFTGSWRGDVGNEMSREGARGRALAALPAPPPIVNVDGQSVDDCLPGLKPDRRARRDENRPEQPHREQHERLRRPRVLDAARRGALKDDSRRRF
jgi:hypothetical protein